MCRLSSNEQRTETASSGKLNQPAWLVVLKLVSLLALVPIIDGSSLTPKRASHEGANASEPCAAESKCVRLLQCPEVDRMAIVRYLSRPSYLRPPSERRWENFYWRRCTLEEDDGQFEGICCPPPNHTGREPWNTADEGHFQLLHENDEVLLRAELFGQWETEKFREKANAVDDEVNFHGGFHGPGDVLPAELVWEGLRDVLTRQALHRITNGTGKVGFRRQKRCLLGEARCEKPHSRYRRFDGRCNNIAPGGSLWGSAGYPMGRVLPPAYDDGIWSPRTVSVTGRYLPTARKLSSTLFADLHQPHEHYNVLLMQFGQFLAHDFSRNSLISSKSKCCTPDGSRRHPEASPGCMSIPVSSGDDFYGQHGVRCMHFMRSAVAPMDDCSAPHGRQLSAVSHFIDGSPIYGVTKEQAHGLRAHEGGRLKSLNHRRYHNELPPIEKADGACEKWAELCFRTGDGRSNQLISLVAVHTLMLREHNRVAKGLHRRNPHWSDGTLYQEARRIVVGQLQHIVYNEYLPKVVGQRYATLYGLHPTRGEYSDAYSDRVDPSVTSEFTVAAFRFGHSTVPSKFELKDGPVETWHTFLDPTRFRERTFYDDLFHTLQRQPMESVDELFSSSVTRFLDVKAGKSYGVDLSAINIQRGRDHAVRPYNDYLRLVGKAGVSSFDDYGEEMGRKLRSLYAHPDDVDLYVGGVLETPIEGAVVGETFAELISEQFSRFRKGDRYFYSHGPESNPGHFTLPQLKAIQQTTMAALICANAGDAHDMYVLPDAFALPHEGNRPVSCTSPDVPRLDLEWWKD
ncbi:AGAP004036-PA-like protein [Anopheles sinensis]|uniref:AGAP004036-PA-like protein n=1 Tax=Anopheles sinensis TaxID=74873 RepID=A0A084VTJ7_ANOSI|nr:AGAP004036-PA-like protein [Anopheles sinensis]